MHDKNQGFPSGYRATARAIVVVDQKLLVFERWRRTFSGKTLHYYSIPGGGIDHGETPEEAVVREMREEMSVKVQPVKLLARQIASKRHNYHHYFLCEIIEGVPIFNTNSEEGHLASIGVSRYKVAWLPIAEAAQVMKHQEYTQFAEILPALLTDQHGQTVDIAS
jgi:ADP-ribose pyrophosphatase YjhB (NUDIX family)